MSFNDILAAIEKQPDDDQKMLLDIVCRRRIARRRAQLVKDVAEAKREYRAGKCKVVTPAEIMREILR